MQPNTPDYKMEVERRLQKADETTIKLETTLEDADLTDVQHKPSLDLAKLIRETTREDIMRLGITAAFGGREEVPFRDITVPRLENAEPMEYQVAYNIAKQAAKNLVTRGPDRMQGFQMARAYVEVIDKLTAVLLARPRRVVGEPPAQD